MAISFPGIGVDRSLSRVLTQVIKATLRVDDILSPVALSASYVEVEFDLRRRSYIVGVMIPHIHYYRRLLIAEELITMAVSSYSVEVSRMVEEDLRRYSNDPSGYFEALFKQRREIDDGISEPPELEESISELPGIRLLKT